ncbi:mitochondrial import receptor subunit TOM6 homolog [Lethenteron reissneri]|uniref:mitochondrial import receptor subunit TOM6 homolog n=1 Tax=Lethenteron reissneri TaxID=7753 RepID=UPI002AB7B3A0|nr:mitochondrial import receptor subunit TOM6 homolog [Lethenteron reissneri]XP_061430110.1 mitochondrial import receptor subunit TOM6 homolog [Lethenteron reissneri]
MAPKARGVVAMARAAVGFISDRTDFKRNLLVNVALFAAGVWVARNVADLDLMAPAPLP